MIICEDLGERSVDVFMQFDLARKAVQGFRDTPGAIGTYADTEIANFRKDMQ